MIKLYCNGESQDTPERKHSLAECPGCKKNVVSGNPETNYISTSFVERSNLTMKMGMRRFTRLSNAFSKKIEKHCHAITLHFLYYNFVRIHKTLRLLPAMEVKLFKRLMTIEDIARLIPDEAPKKVNYKKKEKSIILG